MKTDAAVKLKSDFTYQKTDNENSSENNLMINIWARKNVIDWLIGWLIDDGFYHQLCSSTAENLE